MGTKRKFDNEFAQGFAAVHADCRQNDIVVAMLRYYSRVTGHILESPFEMRQSAVWQSGGHYTLHTKTTVTVSELA